MPTVPKKDSLATIAPFSPQFQSGNAPRGAFGPKPVGGELAQQFSNQAAEIATNIQRNRNAVERTRQYNDARTKMRDLFTAEQNAGSDFANPENVKKFQDEIRAVSDQTLANHTGGDLSAGILSQALENEIQRYLDLGAARGLAANKAQVTNAIGDQMTTYANAVANDPGSLSDQMSVMEQNITTFYGDVLTPAEMQAQVDAGKSMMVTEAVNSMLAKPGGVEAASKLLLDPEALQALSPKQRIELRSRVLETERARYMAKQEVGVVRSKLAAALGVPESEVPDSLMLQAMQVTSKTPEDVVKTVDKNGAIRYTKKSEAPGLEAPPDSGTTVNIDQAGESAFKKEIGKLEAARVDTLNTAAAQAHRDTDEIVRMEAALDSNQFRTGSFAFQRQLASRLAEFLGVPQDNEFWNLIGKAETADVLDAAMNRLAISEAQKLGRITNMSLQFIKDSLPNLIRTPGGNRILVAVMKRSAQRQIELADLANNYARTFNTLNPTDKQWQEQYPDIPRMSFSEAQAFLEKNDPVVNEDLRKKMRDAAASAPKSTAEAIKQARPAGLPDDATYTGRVRERDGAQLWSTPDGKYFHVYPNRR